MKPANKRPTTSSKWEDCRPPLLGFRDAITGKYVFFPFYTQRRLKPDDTYEYRAREMTDDEFWTANTW